MESMIGFTIDKIESIYETLPENEVNILGALVMQVLGRKVFPGEFGGAGGAVGGGGEAAAVEEVVEEKKEEYTYH